LSDICAVVAKTAATPILDVGPNEFQFVFLGTGASMPSKYRNVTSIYLDFFEKGGMLLDCGEGTLGQLRRFTPQCLFSHAFSELNDIFLGYYEHVNMVSYTINEILSG
jgi:hypothetical protein